MIMSATRSRLNSSFGQPYCQIALNLSERHDTFCRAVTFDESSNPGVATFSCRETTFDTVRYRSLLG